MDNIVKCESCGCIGNCDCGAECIDEYHGCELNYLLICPCCEKLGVEKNKERWKNDTNQKGGK